MVKFIERIIMVIGGIALIALFAVIGGTIVWLIWPVVVPAVFPGLVAAGTVAAKLTWWVSVCLTWLCAILIKTSTSSSK